MKKNPKERPISRRIKSTQKRNILDMKGFFFVKIVGWFSAQGSIFYGRLKMD